MRVLARRTSEDRPSRRRHSAAQRERRTGPLDALEIADAAILSDLSVGLCLAARLLPFGAALTAAAVAPMAAVVARHRVRAVVAAAVSAAAVALVAGGGDVATQVLGCAALGALVGVAIRRGWSARRTLAAAAGTLWPTATIAVVGALALLTSLRTLTLVQVSNGWAGVRRVLTHLHLGALVPLGDAVVRWVIDYWWIAASVALFVVVEAATAVALMLARPTVRALARSVPVMRLPRVVDEAAPVAPVPVRLDDVTFRYPGAPSDALRSVSVAFAPGELVAVCGRNGSGKSTLAAVLAGARPTAGTVSRPGRAGLGEDAGTAVIHQRPEAQVLGMRGRDDVVWGLTTPEAIDVGDLLRRVGLSGFEDRDTQTLSGGELQRLAVASALARRPTLLISDEATAMLDRRGREALMALFADLARQGTAVVHVSHHRNEADVADVVVRLDGGRVVAPAASVAPLNVSSRRPRVAVGAERDRPPAVDLAGLGHVYDEGTPWERRALRDVELRVGKGEGVVIEGPNGSGKTTLAWIIAGLVTPSEGRASVDAAPADVGRHVGLSFQHPRLQLQRIHVREEVRDASGAPDDVVDDALRRVQLDPVAFADRRVDDLSGGEQRRVAIAAMLAQRRDVLILDEPFSGLDAAGVEVLADVLAELRATQDITVIVISHDDEATERFADRRVRLEHGRVVADSHPLAPRSTTPSNSTSRRSRRAGGLHLFRVLPQRGWLHELAAATKLVALAVLGVAVAVSPQWPMLGSVALLLAAACAAGQVPWRARPTPPRWFVVALGAGIVLSLLAGGAPNVRIGTFSIGLGALFDALRATCIGLVMVAAGLLVSWTTELADVAPALRWLTSPLERLRVPVAEWSFATAIGMRGLPLLIDETRTLAAARKLRTSSTARPRLRALPGEAVRLLVAALTVAARRAREFAAAVESRGGVTDLGSRRPRLSTRDAIATAAVVVAVAAGQLL